MFQEAVDGQGTTVASRDAKAAEVMGKEGGGSIYLRTVHNDGTRESCEVLVALKNIFAKQVHTPPRDASAEGRRAGMKGGV
jgi:hypothetical protein